MVVEADTIPLPEDPDTIVEAEVLHWPEEIFPPEWPASGAAGSFPLSTGPTTPFTVHVTGAGQPLAHATVRLSAHGVGGSSDFRGVSDGGGSCTFALPFGSTPSMALISPAGGFWPMLARGSALAAPIECPALPADGPHGWWHKAIGLEAEDPALGQGIRVGVVDSGGGPHACLPHVEQVGAFIRGSVLPPASAADVGGHGSHICGTIGARPAERGHYGGVAPGCDLLVARVFALPDGSASSADIANAIDALSLDHRADIINLSLGSDTPSEVVRLAIEEAADRGTICICAAGNNGGAVLFPAAFAEAVAVAALGLTRWAPAGSLSGTRLPIGPALFGLRDLYAASFTSHGAAVDCAAPGVGILATVPNRHGTVPLYAAMDGSSMACPVVSGALAACLSRSADYRALPRDARRTEMARKVLTDALRSVGLPPEYEGRGMPWLGVASA